MISYIKKTIFVIIPFFIYAFLFTNCKEKQTEVGFEDDPIILNPSKDLYKCGYNDTIININVSGKDWRISKEYIVYNGINSIKYNSTDIDSINGPFFSIKRIKNIINISIYKNNTSEQRGFYIYINRTSSAPRGIKFSQDINRD